MSLQQTAIKIYEGTINAFKDAALDDNNQFTEEQREELVELISKAYNKENITIDLTKIQSILSEFGILYEKYGGAVDIVHRNLLNNMKRAKP